MLFIGYGLEWIVSAFLRGATNTDQVRAWLRVYRASLPVSGPGLLVLILSGAYLAQISGAMKNGWLSASFLAIFVALVIGFVFILPRVKAIRGALPEGSAALSSQRHRASPSAGPAHADPRPRHARARHRLSNDREGPTLFFLRCSSSEPPIVLGVLASAPHIFQTKIGVRKSSH